jgi:hypothetical protein
MVERDQQVEVRRMRVESLGVGALEDAIASGYPMKSNRIRSVISRKNLRHKPSR